jgi:ribose transport system substrate-binding protein
MRNHRNLALPATLTVTVFSVVLAGCSAKDDSSDKASDGSSKGYTVAYIQGVSSDESFIKEACGVKAVAKKLGVTVNVQGPTQFDATLQIPIVQSIAATKPDAVIITPTDSKALFVPLKTIVDAGAKVVTTDNPLTTPEGVVSTHVSTDFALGGQMSADALGEATDGAEGSVLMLAVQPGVASQDAAVKGFTEELAKYPNLTPLDVQYDMHDPAKAAQIVQATILAHPDLVGVFGANTQSTDGAGTGLRNQDKTGDIKLVGMTSSSAVPLLEQDVASALVIGNQIEVGEKAMQAAVDVLDGKTVEPNIAAGYVTATKETLDEPDVAELVQDADC